MGNYGGVTVIRDSLRVASRETMRSAEGLYSTGALFWCDVSTCLQDWLNTLLRI